MYRSLREAARQLTVNRYWLKGYCDGRRIRLVRVGVSLALTPEAFERVRRELETLPQHGLRAGASS